MVRPVCLFFGELFEDGVTEFIGLKKQKENQACVTRQIQNCNGLNNKTCIYHTETKEHNKRLGGWLIAKTDNRFSLAGFENKFGVYTLLNDDFFKLLDKINKN